MRISVGEETNGRNVVKMRGFRVVRGSGRGRIKKGEEKQERRRETGKEIKRGKLR